MTTDGDLVDEHEERIHDASDRAWDDYSGRILELEVHGFTRTGEKVTYGKRWACELRRGAEQIRVSIERTSSD